MTPADSHAATTLGLVAFIEYGPHKTIQVLNGPASGTLRVSDQKLIDGLREAFERAGFEVEDHVR